MAQKSHSPEKPRGSGKIKFIMLEADISDVDLTELTQAITAALAPSALPRRMVIAQPTLRSTVAAAQPGAPTESDDVEIELVEETEKVVVDAPVEAAPTAPRKKKTHRAPEVIDMDLETQKPNLEEFATPKNPSATAQRYLVVMAWLKEHGGVVDVTIDHIYTCFRRLKWSTNIEDFGQTFRDLKSSGWVSKGSATGQWRINHLGLDRVTKIP